MLMPIGQNCLACCNQAGINRSTVAQGGIEGIRKAVASAIQDRGLHANRCRNAIGDENWGKAGEEVLASAARVAGIQDHQLYP